MRVLRTFFWAALLAAGFVYITGGTRWDVGRVLRPVRNAGRLWSEPTRRNRPGFSTDEQNNIDIYKSARDATVFITSTVYTRSFLRGISRKRHGHGLRDQPRRRNPHQ